MKEIETRFVPFAESELRADKAEDKRYLRGYAAVFGQWGSESYGFKEKIAPGAFIDTINADDIRCLFNHDSNHVMGRNRSGTLTMKEDEHGLFMENLINEDDPDALSVFAKVARGDVSGQSFSFIVKEDPEWQTWEYPKGGLPERTIKRVKLFDVGAVTFPFYEQTDVSVALRMIETRKLEIINAKEENERQGSNIEILRLKLNLKEKVS
jgi:hypothetical protein